MKAAKHPGVLCEISGKVRKDVYEIKQILVKAYP
jgi:hypothetical protein